MQTLRRISAEMSLAVFAVVLFTCLFFQRRATIRTVVRIVTEGARSVRVVTGADATVGTLVLLDRGALGVGVAAMRWADVFGFTRTYRAMLADPANYAPSSPGPCYFDALKHSPAPFTTTKPDQPADPYPPYAYSPYAFAFDRSLDPLSRVYPLDGNP